MIQQQKKPQEYESPNALQGSGSGYILSNKIVNQNPIFFFFPPPGGRKVNILKEDFFSLT